MQSPLWHIVGIFGGVGFVLMLLMIIIARTWFGSKNPAKVKLGAAILIYLGGAVNARALNSDMQRRNIV